MCFSLSLLKVWILGFHVCWPMSILSNIGKQSGIGNWAPEPLQKSSQVNFHSKPFHSIHTFRLQFVSSRTFTFHLQLNKRFHIQLCTGFIGLNTNQIVRMYRQHHKSLRRNRFGRDFLISKTIFWLVHFVSCLLTMKRS